jgi:hypothetical protein
MNQEKLLRERISNNFELIIKAKKDIALCNKALFKIAKNGNKETTTNNDGNIPERPEI